MSTYVDGNHWRTAMGVGVTGSVFAIISVGARLYTRYFVTKSVGVDDLMAIASLIATIGMFISLCIYSAWYIKGTAQVWTQAEVGNFLLILWINELVYNIGTLFIKWTYLFQYLRVFRNVKAMRIAYLICIVVVGLWYACQIFGFVFNCRPVSGFWDKTIASNCNSKSDMNDHQASFFYLNASGTLVIDIIVLALPIPTIWNLKLQRRQKWAIFGIFAVGGIVPAITIARIASLSTIDGDGFVDLSIWALAELCAGVITAALATIRLLVSSKVPVFGVQPSAVTLNVQKRSPFSTYSSRKMARSGSQRDLVLADEFELHGSSTGNSSIDIRKDEFSSSARIASRESSSERGSKDRGRQLGIQEGTESLHFGLSPAARSGVQTTISSDRSRSMAASGAEFLGTFGILVEQDWEVSESVVA